MPNTAAPAAPPTDDVKTKNKSEDQLVRDGLPSGEDVQEPERGVLRDVRGRKIPNIGGIVDPGLPTPPAADEGGDAGAPGSEVPVESGLDSDLVGIARSLGVSDDKVSTFTDDDRLASYLEGLAESRDRREPAPDTKAQQFTPERKAALSPEDFSDRNYQLKLKPLEKDGEYGDELVAESKAFHSYVAHTDKQIRELESIVGNMYTYIASSAQQQTATEADAYFAAHPEHQDVFGEGGTAGLDPHSAHARNRKKLEKYVDRQRLGFKAQNQTAPGFVQLAAEGVPGLFSKQTTTRIKREIGTQMKKRQSQATHPPGPKVADQEMPRRDKAIAKVAQWYRDQGY